MAMRRLSKRFGSKDKELPNLSAGFDSRSVQVEALARYGIASRILAASYDQVQSLLAIATEAGVYVFGQAGVEAFFLVPDGRSAAHLVIHRSHLVVIDTKSTLYSWLLEGDNGDPVARQTLRGIVISTYVEPSVNWLFLGLKDGTVDLWDLEGEQFNPRFKIKDQYKERQEEWQLMDEWYASKHTSPVLGMLIHPLDLGLVLMVYDVGVALYSIKENVVKQHYEVSLPADNRQPARRPKPSCATFSPDGRFVVVGYEEGILAFFETYDAEIPLQIRTLGESDINIPKRQTMPEEEELSYGRIEQICWCARIEPSDSYLLVAGGFSRGLVGVSLMDFGKASVKTNMSEYFAFPQRQRIFPVDFDSLGSILPLGCASPYHGYHDPRCLLLLSKSGEMAVLDLPNGEPTEAALLPVSLSFSSPAIGAYTIAEFPRSITLELQNALKRQGAFGRAILVGGSPAKPAPLRTSQLLCVLQGQSLVRLYDISHGDLFGPALAEIDASLIFESSPTQKLAVSGCSGEIALAAVSGKVVIYRYNAGSNIDSIIEHFSDLSLMQPLPSPIPEAKNMLFAFDRSIRNRPGFQPLCTLDAERGEILNLYLSDVGFAVIGYDSGYIIIIDLRGPAIIFCATCESLTKEKQKTKKQQSYNNAAFAESLTTSAVMALGLDGRISLSVMLGTSTGRILCLELLKEQHGGYSILIHNTKSGLNESPVVAILACNAAGQDSLAVPDHLPTLQDDIELPDCIISVHESGLIAFAGEAQIGKASLDSPANSARLVQCGAITVCAVAKINGDLELFSIPSLDRVGFSRIPVLNKKSNICIRPSGDIVSGSAMNELTLTNIFGSHGRRAGRYPDALFDVLKAPSIPRPTISNWAWITGTQHIKPTDLDQILSGGDRPLSRRAQERLIASEKQQQLLERNSAMEKKQNENAQKHAAREASTQQAYRDMTDGGYERGERVNHVSDVMDNIEKASGEWLSEIDKITKSAKKAAFRSMIGL